MIGFRLCDLPRVLQDAITITKALSLSYIWADALCIIQNVDSDWEQESSQMGDIYGSAYVTICSRTSSCQLSFLEPELPKVDISFQSLINSDIAGSYNLSYLDAHINRFGRHSRIKGIPKSRWFSRGWTYQELVFSRRLLLFCPPYLEFMCLQLFSIIGGPNCTPPRVNLYELLEDAKEIHYNWLEVVEIYSDRILTYPQDVLPAISGTAMLFSDKLSDDYLAGIWRSDLRGLVWKYQNLSVTPSQDLRKALTRLNSLQDCVAPSWSWAGHRGIAFDVPRSMWQPQCQPEISTTIDGQNIFGRVKGGQLTITGPTYDIGPYSLMSICRPKVRRTVILTLQDGQDISLFLDWEAKGGTLRGIFKLVPIATYQSTYNGDVTTTTTGLVTHKAQKEGNFHNRVGRFDLDSPAEGVHNLFVAGETETITII